MAGVSSGRERYLALGFSITVMISHSFQVGGKGSVLGRRFKREGKGSVLRIRFKWEGKGSELGRRF